MKSRKGTKKSERFFKKEVKKELDPITYEVLKHKVWQILWEGREAMLHVSGSPVVSEQRSVCLPCMMLKVIQYHLQQGFCFM